MRRNINKGIMLQVWLLLIVLLAAMQSKAVRAETEWNKKDYSIEADNGETVDISVVVFQDEAGIYWKQTKKGLELYSDNGNEDYQAIDGDRYILLNGSLY